jgi:hypothetical protein
MANGVLTTGRAMAACTVASALACGGGGGGPATPNPSGPQTVTFMGVANPSCQLGGHNFEAGDGAIALTLVQSTGSVGLHGQVCAGGIDNNDCSINKTPMVVGQTLTGSRKGASSQNVKMLTLNCGVGAAPPGPVDYTITIVHQR